MTTTPTLDRESTFLTGAAFTAVNAAPTAVADAHFSTKQYSRIRLYADYTAITALNVEVWNYDRTADHWFRLGSSDEIDAFVPTNGDEARDFFVGRGQYVYLRVQTLTGTNVKLYVRGIDSGVDRV